MWKTKAVVTGGGFKQYNEERGQENLKSEPGEEPPTEGKEQLYFGWKQNVRKYRKVGREKK